MSLETWYPESLSGCIELRRLLLFNGLRRITVVLGVSPKASERSFLIRSAGISAFVLPCDEHHFPVRSCGTLFPAWGGGSVKSYSTTAESCEPVFIS